MVSRASLKLNARCVLFTWKQVVGADVPEDDARDEMENFKARVFDKLIERFDPCKVLCGVERHADGGWHCHACLVRSSNRQVKIGTAFDVDGHTVDLSPHGWRPHEVRNGGFEYAGKEDECPLANFDDLDEVMEELFPGGSSGSAPDTSANVAYTRAMDADCYDAAMAIIKQDCPRDFVMEHAKIKRFFQDYFKPKFVAKFGTDDFIRDPIHWGSVSPRASVVIYGPPGMGKSHYALAHFEKPLFTRHIDGLKGLSCEHDGIILDEISLKKWPAGSIKALLDCELPSDIHCRHSCAHIPAGMRKIICVNNWTDLIPETYTEVDYDAIVDRMHLIEITSKLY